MSKSSLKAGLAAVCLGCLMVAALPPYNLWPFMFAGFSLFYVLLSRIKTVRGAFACSWLFGFGYFSVGLWWIANALLVDGNDFKWVWPFAIAGLPALLSFFPALAGAACARCADRSRLAGFLSFVVAFAFSEWLRGHIFTGFPWNLYGYAWSGWLAMAQVVSVGGSYFLTLLTLFWTVLPGFLFVWTTPRPKKIILLSIGLVTFVAAALYGSVRLSHYTTIYDDAIAVRPVQANIPQADKMDTDKAAINLSKMLALSTPDPGKPEAAVTLIVWPETALEFYVLANEHARAMIRETLGHYKNTVYLVTGLLRMEAGAKGKDKYFNSLVVLDRELNLRAVYSKSHLVPFGEYIPFQDVVPMSPFVSFQGFTSGGGITSVSVDGVPPFSPLVCYEVIFPGAVAGKGHPEWLLNVTNDAWYGDSSGPRQHLAMTQFRAIEEGLPLVRSAQTGISGVIDPVGRILWQASLNTKDAHNVSLPRALPGGTLYVRTAIRDVLFFICLLLTGVTAYVCRLRNSPI